MPRKLRQLIADLEKAGFKSRGGKGSHRNYIHPDCPLPIVISGKSGKGAKPYQEKAVKAALKEVKK